MEDRYRIQVSRDERFGATVVDDSLDVGTVEFSRKEVEVALRDLTGFEGRSGHEIIDLDGSGTRPEFWPVPAIAMTKTWMTEK